MTYHFFHDFDRKELAPQKWDVVVSGQYLVYPAKCA
jgi:hypothetical protein